MEVLYLRMTLKALVRDVSSCGIVTVRINGEYWRGDIRQSLIVASSMLVAEKMVKKNGLITHADRTTK